VVIGVERGSGRTMMGPATVKGPMNVPIITPVRQYERPRITEKRGTKRSIIAFAEVDVRMGEGKSTESEEIRATYNKKAQST
jgi:hypothetical protein